MDNIYNGSVISKEHKEKRGFFYIEELFQGECSLKKAPETIRQKMSADDIEDVELNIKCINNLPMSSKVVFKDYKHFRKTLEEVEINMKKYYKKK